MLWRIDSRGIHRIGIASLSSPLCKRLYIVITPANVYIYCYYFHTCAKFIYYYHPCTRLYIIIIIFTPVQSLYIIITPANVCKLYISIPPVQMFIIIYYFHPCANVYILLSPLQMLQNYPSVRTLRFVCTCNNPAGTFSDSARSRQFSPHGSGPSGSSFELNAFLLIKSP